MTISEITNFVWSIAGLLGTGSIAIYLWRRPDSALRIRHRDAEIQLGSESKSNESADNPTHPLPLPEVAEQTPSGTLLGSETVMGVGQEGTVFLKAWELFENGNYEEGIKLITLESLSMTDVRKRIGYLAFGQHLAAEKGSLQALKDLRESRRVHPDNYEVRLWLGITEYGLGDLTSSVSEFDAAYSLAESDDDRSSVDIWRARIIRSTDNPGASATYLVSSAKSVHDRKAKARLVSQAAVYLLEVENQNLEMAFSLYEYAASLDPSDTGLRFDIAKAYGDAKGHSFAFFHYSELLGRDQKSAGAHNNLGVAASELGLDSFAVDSYKRAEELGNTLATSNLAWKLITSGFLLEARERLQSKLESPGVHRNVLEALGGISRQQQTEDSKKETITKHARLLSRVRTRIAKSIVEGETLMPGTYIYTQGSKRLQFQIDATGEIQGEFTGTLVNQHLTGKAEGLSISFTWETPKSTSSTTLLGSFPSRGYGVLIVEKDSCWGFMVEGGFQLDPTQGQGFVACELILSA